MTLFNIFKKKDELFVTTQEALMLLSSRQDFNSLQFAIGVLIKAALRHKYPDAFGRLITPEEQEQIETELRELMENLQPCLTPDYVALCDDEKDICGLETSMDLRQSNFLTQARIWLIGQHTHSLKEILEGLYNRIKRSPQDNDIDVIKVAMEDLLLSEDDCI